MGFFSKLETATSPADLAASNTAAEDEILGPAVAALSERDFCRALAQERKRSERSRKNFVLMLLRSKGSELRNGAEGNVLHSASSLVSRAIRDTDILGWFTQNSVVGAIFSELGSAELNDAIRRIEEKLSTALARGLHPHQLAELEISMYSYPQTTGDGNGRSSLSPELFPDLVVASEENRRTLFAKRVLDVIGSSLALLVLSPLFALLALLIKLTSKGPVFYRQERLGQFQKHFVFLKFRSMYVSTSSDIHRDYVRNYIAGRVEPGANERGNAVYKLTNDPRVTWIGKFMRRTSLDELPQFWNVLKGEMSLVGPRPPIPYEIEAYDFWHRRRLLEAKPGITGLWQVHGRSRTTFDEMVRLDLQYSRKLSVATDIKILFETPRAVISGDGAY